jgi:serine/threonine-protein kinase RsbW
VLRSSHLAAARHQASDFLAALGVHRLCIEDVLVALTEATANAVMHSGADAADIRLAVLDDYVRLIVTDRGVGFKPDPADLSRRPGLLSPGGRGLYLISCVMDSVQIDGAHGTTITMVKHLRPADCLPRG